MGETLYTIGTDQQQAWMKKNCFPPRGYGYSEPGTYSLQIRLNKEETIVQNASFS